MSSAISSSPRPLAPAARLRPSLPRIAGTTPSRFLDPLPSGEFPLTDLYLQQEVLVRLPPERPSSPTFRLHRTSTTHPRGGRGHHEGLGTTRSLGASRGICCRDCRCDAPEAAGERAEEAGVGEEEEDKGMVRPSLQRAIELQPAITSALGTP